MKIKIPETTRDDKNFSSMSVSHEEVRIPKKQKIKYQKLYSLRIK